MNTSKINEKKLYKHIGQQIQKRRKSLESRLTQEILAQRVGLTRTSIANLEAGNQRTPLHQIYEICAELNLKIEDVIPPVEEIVEPKVIEIGYVTVGEKKKTTQPKTAFAINSILEGDS